MRTEGCKWVSNPSYNGWVEMKWVFYNVRGAQYRLWWAKQSAKCKSAQERGRVKSNNTILRARDKLQRLETRSELQRGSERCGMKFYLFFLYVQGSVEMKWVFYNARGVRYLLRWAERSAKCKSAQERGRAKWKRGKARESAGERSLITWYRVWETKYKV
jgi:hypothetical protein